MLHGRHSTCILIYAKFPNTYLWDISLYGEEYTKRVEHPHQVIIQQSEPFRMQSFFERCFTTSLTVIVKLDILLLMNGIRTTNVSTTCMYSPTPIRADYKIRPMYECLLVKLEPASSTDLQR